MRRTLFTAVSLPLLFACELPAENAGEVADGGDGGVAPLGEIVERPLESGDSHRMLVLPDSSRVRHLVRSRDGVLAVTASCCDSPRMRVSELDADMQTLWTLDLGDVGLHHVAPLDDGGWLVSGVSPGGSNDPAIWKLSCCGELDSKHEYRDYPKESQGFGVQPLGDGFVFAAHLYDGDASRMRWTFLDEEFNETSTTESPLTTVAANYVGLRRTLNNTAIAFVIDLGGPSTMFEIAGPGQVSSRIVDGLLVPVGDGADLGWMVFENGHATFTRYGDVTTPTAPFDRAPLAIPDRHSHIAFLFGDETGDHVAEVADDGTVLRRVTLPVSSPDVLFTIPFAVAVAEDDSIFAGIDEDLAGGGEQRAVIHHLPAL